MKHLNSLAGGQASRGPLSHPDRLRGPPIAPEAGAEPLLRHLPQSGQGGEDKGQVGAGSGL